MQFKRTFEIYLDAGVGRTGHRFRIQVTTLVRYDSKTGQTSDSELVDQLQLLRLELHDRSLNDMLPGVPSTAAGLAAYVMERLSLAHPRLYKVRVWQTPEDCITLTREIRT